jgi:hypothetical protein
MRFSCEKLSSGVLEVYRQVLGTHAEIVDARAVAEKRSVKEKGKLSAPTL